MEKVETDAVDVMGQSWRVGMRNDSELPEDIRRTTSHPPPGKDTAASLDHRDDVSGDGKILMKEGNHFPME